MPLTGRSNAERISRRQPERLITGVLRIARFLDRETVFICQHLC